MRALFLVAMMVAFPTASAGAQSGDSAHVATARALFQDGVALARRGEYVGAADHFRRSHALHPATPVAYNLASALVHTGALVEASEILAQLLRDPSVTEVVRRASERLRGEVLPRLARLTVRLAGDPSEAHVELDAHALPEAAIGAPMPIDPGEHDVRVLRGDEVVGHEHLELADGEVRALVLTIGRREIPAVEIPRAAIEIDVVPASSPDEPAPRGGDDGVWIGVGVGVALVAAGAIAATAIVLTMPAGPAPVSGNAMPGVLTW